MYLGAGGAELRLPMCRVKSATRSYAHRCFGVGPRNVCFFLGESYILDRLCCFPPAGATVLRKERPQFAKDGRPSVGKWRLGIVNIRQVLMVKLKNAVAEWRRNLGRNSFPPRRRYA